MDKKFDRLEDRFDRLEMKVDINTDSIKSLEQKVDTVAYRQDTLENFVTDNYVVPAISSWHLRITFGNI